MVSRLRTIFRLSERARARSRRSLNCASSAARNAFFVSPAAAVPAGEPELATSISKTSPATPAPTTAPRSPSPRAAGALPGSAPPRSAHSCRRSKSKEPNRLAARGESRAAPPDQPGTRRRLGPAPRRKNASGRLICAPHRMRFAMRCTSDRLNAPASSRSTHADPFPGRGPSSSGLKTAAVEEATSSASWRMLPPIATMLWPLDTGSGALGVRRAAPGGPGGPPPPGSPPSRSATHPSATWRSRCSWR